MILPIPRLGGRHKDVKRMLLCRAGTEARFRFSATGRARKRRLPVTLARPVKAPA